MEFASESVEGVRFGFMSDEEVKRLSFKKITSPLFLDPIGGPISGGLYDPTLGPMDESTNCKSCGQRYYNCPGHFGHIDLVSVVYNPLLFGTLVNILRRTCFFCLQFTSNEEEVKNCVMRLKLIVKGDIVGAKELELDVKSPSSSTRKLSGSSDKQEWTSLQLNEARSVLREFLTFKSRKCKRCAQINPSLKKHTVGWIHMSGMSDATIRANVIKGHKIGRALTDGDDDKSAASEVDNNDDPVSGGVDISTGRGTSSIAIPGEVKKRKKKEEPLTEGR